MLKKELWRDEVEGSHTYGSGEARTLKTWCFVNIIAIATKKLDRNKWKVGCQPQRTNHLRFHDYTMPVQVWILLLVEQLVGTQLGTAEGARKYKATDATYSLEFVVRCSPSKIGQQTTLVLTTFFIQIFLLSYNIKINKT